MAVFDGHAATLSHIGPTEQGRASFERSLVGRCMTLGQARSPPPSPDVRHVTLRRGETSESGAGALWASVVTGIQGRLSQRRTEALSVSVTQGTLGAHERTSRTQRSRSVDIRAKPVGCTSLP
jgi:hypothetical protein